MAAFRTSPDVWPEMCQKHRKIICVQQVWLRWFWVSVWYGWSEADLPKLNKKAYGFPYAFLFPECVVFHLIA
jgi:hypothetical protein